MPIVRIDWAEGRTDEMKATLIRNITREIHEVTGAPVNRIVILINDFPHTNVGLDGEPKA